MPIKIAILFSFAIGVSSVGATEFGCKPENIINQTASNEFYFPANWDGNGYPPRQAAGQGCSWYFNIPQGYYAKLIVSGQLQGKENWYQIVDFRGHVFRTQDGNGVPYYFAYPQFLISIENKDQVNYGFKVEWAPYPTGVDYRTAISGVPRVVNVTKDVFAAEFSAVTGVSLLAFPVDLKNYYTLRSTMVFEGTDHTGKFVATLDELYYQPNQYMSSGQSLYIVNVEARNVLDKLLIQESGYTKDITAYEGLDCLPSSTCTKPLRPGFEKSGFVYVGNQKQTLTAMTMDKNATLSIYYGSVTKAGFQKSYTGSEIRSQLPLTFNAGVTQYIISNGRTLSTFTFSFSD